MKWLYRRAPWLSFLASWRFYVWSWGAWVTVALLTLIYHCQCNWYWYISVAEAACK